MTIAERLDQLGLDEPDRALVEAFFEVHTGVPAEQGSYLAEVRWWAPSGHDYRLMRESVWTYKLGHGITAVVEALLGDGPAEVWYGMPVHRVRDHGDHVEVAAGDGTVVRASAAVVATPSGVWPDVDFFPALEPNRLAAAREGRLQTVHGRVAFATSDIATGWTGFIDGAIESA